VADLVASPCDPYIGRKQAALDRSEIATHIALTRQAIVDSRELMLRVDRQCLSPLIRSDGRI